MNCPGCGADVPDVDGATHPYIDAAPGCWAVYGEVLAKEYGGWRDARVHRMTVDAYAVQHPGKPGSRETQSVAVHLISLCLTLEMGVPANALNAAMRQALDVGGFTWLEPPARRGYVTVVDVNRAADSAEHGRIVEAWAKAVWAAWAGHHEVVRGWAGRKA